MKRWHLLLVVALSLLFVSLGNAQNEGRHDGNWWQSQTLISKESYVAGFFDGMDLGHKFSYWKISMSGAKSQRRCINKVLTSYDTLSQKYFSHVTNGQLVDGLDTFYSDYRNRKITVSGAVWLVVNSIAGLPEDEFNKMVEGWRANAD